MEMEMLVLDDARSPKMPLSVVVEQERTKRNRKHTGHDVSGTSRLNGIG